MRIPVGHRLAGMWFKSQLDRAEIVGVMHYFLWPEGLRDHQDPHVLKGDAAQLS